VAMGVPLVGKLLRMLLAMRNRVIRTTFIQNWE